MIRVLFVDDEPKILSGLQRMLRSMREEWEMLFAVSAPEAIKILTQTPCEVLITDMRMPGMDGAELLAESLKIRPNMVRIILSGHADPAFIFKSVRVAHQYLAKPCDPELLIGVVKRACALRTFLTDNALQGMIAKIDTLPSLPSLYAEITEELRSPNVSLQKIGGIVSKDVGMTTKILQLVNSAFFGLQRHINNPSQAVNLLGLDTVKALVLSVGIFSQFKADRFPGLSLERLGKHGLATGVLAKTIAQQENQSKMLLDDAFMGGLLHDLGKLILATSFPERYGQVSNTVKEKSISYWQAEKEYLGSTHSEAGAYLANLWGFPDPIIESLAFHHCLAEFQGGSFSPVLAVHVADALENRGASLNGNDDLEVDRAYLSQTGFLGKLPLWIQKGKEILEKGDGHDG